ncbi:E3 ubiquitin-protein ligase TRIM71-like [Oopsacas minuta]|uniref:E3 ubiquitin-protein ligase TRIM71-like n=1 Tax=Oopsacas minuta TaxID=111878 RepID=A0AAV7JCI4_9METZ|nr:E3 ubiquitin-protein ligase TRIM71-like [Oopsacas minuta]
MATCMVYMNMEGQIEEIEKQIEQKFDNIISSVERRRSELLSIVKQLKIDLTNKEIERMDTLQKIESLESVLSSFKVNKLEHIQSKISEQINDEKLRLELDEKEQGYVNFFCNTNEILRKISNLGRIIQQVVPKYSTSKQAITSIGKVGSISSVFNRPTGVAVDDDSERIFVLDTGNHRIQIFSMECEFINEFDSKRLKEPCGIAYFQNSIYVADATLHNVFKYDCTSHPVYIKSLHDVNFNLEDQPRRPLGITVDAFTGEVYLTDAKLNSVLVYSSDLNFLRKFGSNLIHPSDVKVYQDFVYVVDYSRPCLHKFNKSGRLISDIHLLHSSFTIESPQHFTIDCMGNFLISNWKNDTVDIAHPDGDVFCSIGSDPRTGTVLKTPKGVAVTKSALYTKLPNQEGENKIDKEPFTCKLNAIAGSQLTLVLVFHGHYNEPDFEIQLDVKPGIRELKLDYDVSKGVWSHSIADL